jgi:hypothetical protein
VSVNVGAGGNEAEKKEILGWLGAIFDEVNDWVMFFSDLFRFELGQ